MLGWVDTETGALILSADRNGFRGFASLLRKPTRESVQLKEAENWPMARPIGALSVERAGDTVVIKVDGEIARLAGSSAGFERLARELELFAEDDELDEPGSHAHFDPDDGSGVRSVLAADSCPLIVAGPVPDKTAPEA
jgi:hypothetical protein